MATTYYKDPILGDILNEIPRGIQKEVDMFFAISNRIGEILKRKGWSQADLAKAMGKQEAEISKRLSGSHNFTIATIAKIEAALEDDIISDTHRSPKNESGSATTRPAHMARNNPI